MQPEQDRLVKVFDDQALAYDRFRPHYPSLIIESFVELSGLKKGASLLEFGCGTGQLTRDLLLKGFKVLAIEKGGSLARIARKNLADFSAGKVLCKRFESWHTEEKFDGFVAAQAFHWVEKKEGLDKVAGLLKTAGSLGLIWNIDKSHETEFWKKSQTIYDTYLPSAGKKVGVSSAADAYQDYLSQRNDFSPIQRVEYAWEKTFNKEAFLGLLSTFSNHMVLAPPLRAKFFEEMAKLIDAHGGFVTRQYTSVLLFSQKRSA